MKCLFNTLFVLLFLYVNASAQYTILPIAGDDSAGYNGDGLPARQTSLFWPESICWDDSGNLYIGSGFSNNLPPKFTNALIRKVEATTGIVKTIVGTYGFPYAPDTAFTIAASSACLRRAITLCMTPDGKLLIADEYSRIRKMDFATGLVTTVAGHPVMRGYSGDGGPASAALLKRPCDVAVDKMGNIYISECENYVIRKIDALTGIITTFAGSGIMGYSGDGGPATLAKINFSSGICLDNQGNLYIADGFNRRVRKVEAVTGIITTFAGTGIPGYSGDGGIATAAKLSYPASLAIDKHQNLYIVDGAPNFMIRKVEMGTQIISTIAGNGSVATTPDILGDYGPATAASINPVRMCFDSCDNLYMGSSGCRIRALVHTVPTDDWLCGFKLTHPLPTDVSTTTIAAKLPELHISPNPNTGTSTINCSSPTNEPALLTITDITGRLIRQLSTTTNKDTEVQLKAPPGMYFITVTTPTGKCTSKMIIE